MGLLDIFRANNSKTPLGIAVAQDQQGMGNDGWLGPGTPLTPVQGYSGRARAMDFPVGVNIAVKSRQQWGRTSYELLREMLRSYDVAQMCLNHKIDEIRSMEPLFTPMDGAKGDVDKAVEAAKAALAFPDREHSYDEWVSLWLNSMLTFDSGPLKKRRNNAGEVMGLEIIDGSTIYPYIDGHGRRPKAPAPAYYQVIKGQIFQEFTAEDIVYPRFRPQTDSPFGMAPMESIMMVANTDMRFQWHLLQMFTEGSIPGGFMEVPPDVSSPDQVAEWQDYWDATFTGDQSIVHKLIAVPNGAKFTGTAPAAFDANFPKYLAIKVCGAFGVVPQDIGLTDDVNRATGETQTDTQFRVNTLPWVRFVESHLNRYLQHDLGLPVQVKLNTGRDKEDRLQEAQAWKIYTEAGFASVDEAREELLGLATDNLRPVPRFVLSARQGPIPLTSLLSVSGVIDPETKAPVDDVPLSETPFEGTPGVMPDKLPGGTEFKRAPVNPDEPAFPSLEHEHADTGTVAPPTPAGAPATKPVVAKASGEGVTVAGAAIKASDTGRVLMIQRTLDPDDDAAGTWEFPGGHLNPEETAQDAAQREWEEETGLTFPADAQLSAEWASPDGHYAGYVYKIPAEASIPINTGDGEDGETLAWFDPDHLDGFPALRPALAETLPADELAKATAVELAKFRAFTKTRAKAGKWRDFEFEAIPAPVAKHLNDTGREQLAKDSNGSDAGPKAGTPSWRDTPPVTAPVHTVDLALTDYWSPRITDALTQMWAEADLANAITATDGIGPMGLAVFRDVARQVLNGSVQASTLDQVVRAAWADAYTAGALAGQVQMDGTAEGWDAWKPGMTASNKVTALGWKEALQDANITLKGITDTTTNRLAYAIADGVNAGHPSDKIAQALNSILDDPARAELIAHTETARMLNNAVHNQYRAFGVTAWDLLISAGACPTCTDIAASNPHPMTDTDNQPPLHPRCRCATAPHIEGNTL